MFDHLTQVQSSIITYINNIWLTYCIILIPIIKKGLQMRYRSINKNSQVAINSDEAFKCAWNYDY